MIMMDDFFRAWGKHFGDPNFKPSIAVGAQMEHLRVLNNKFEDKLELSTVLDMDYLAQYAKDDWAAYLENVDPEEVYALGTDNE